MADLTVIETDVLIVGAGPSGGTASLALGAYGIANICLSKYVSPAQTPRAHITNQRTMEVLRHFGLEDQALAVATPHALMGDQVYCTTLAGIEIGRTRTWHTHPRYRAQHDLISPCSMVDLTQNLLEPIILTGAMHAGSQVRFSTELISFKQDDNGVDAVILDRITEARTVVRAKYMIGADGANSFVAETLGLPLEGPANFAANFGIRFKADLSRFVEHRPGVLYWLIQPGRGIGGYPIAGLRMVKAWDRWIVTWGRDPNKPVPEFTHEELVAIVHRIIGDVSVPIEIEGTYPWSMNRIHAKKYGLGRVFCVGDAVHRHPPMNGLGSNTSVQDAFNLSWKLALVIRGLASPALLDSYEAERLPIGHTVVRRATDNFSVYAPVAEALGFRPGQQTQAQFDNLPRDLADSSATGVARRAELRAAIANNIIGFGAIGGEHNQFYQSEAIVADDHHLSVDDPDMDVIFGLESGRRLPHVWLTRHHRRVSTLDMCVPGTFTLITGLGGRDWIDIAADITERTGVPLHVVLVGPGHAYEDPYGDFASICLPDETGAVLVRPDLFVAWHVRQRPAQPAATLASALQQILGNPVMQSA